MRYRRLSDALRDVALAPAKSLDEALDEYYAPDYIHRSGGRVLDRAAFAAMAGDLRGRIHRGTVTVLDELRDGRTYAERHVYQVLLVTGETLRKEISVFGRYAPDGRFQEINEIGFTLGGDGD